jgi:protein subunit release factor A
MKKIMTINAAEGGADSRLFVADLAEAYLKLATRFG